MELKDIIEFELSKDYRDRFQQALDEKDVPFIQKSLVEVNPADITTLLYEFTDVESKYVLDILPLETRAEIINGLDSDTRIRFIKVYTPEEISAVINQLASDDAADILNELPVRESEEVLARLDAELRAQVVDLLRYDEHLAGGLMAKELIKARESWTVVQCVEEIRKQAENVSTFYAVWVVDDQDKLLGKVALQKLILSDPRTLVKDIYEEEIVSVETYMEDREVAEVMKKYDLESVPVVNVQGHLVGRITIDDVVDVITEQAEEDRQAMAGITEDIEEDDSIWRNTRARLPWLLVGILGGVLSARFMGIFQLEIERIAAIAFFIPLIQATGGNVGIQSSSLVVQSLANPGFVEEELWPRLQKVFLVALLNGLVLSSVVFGATGLIFGFDRLTVVVAIALFCVILFASLIGTITPLILNRLGFNPALASGPFITTTNDLMGLTLYFLTIHILL